jgi:hypothetical protein
MLPLLRTSLPAAVLSACSLLAAPAQAAEHYVALQGSDSAPGTITRPWRTFKKALPALRPGDVLTVRGGTYVERVTGISIRPATAASPVIVRACIGERPVLKGLLWLSRPSYWQISGLNVTWDPATGQPNEHMVKLTNGIGWSFTDAEVWGARSYAGILVASTATGEPRDWRIAGCSIHDTYASNSTNQDHLIYCNAGLTGSGGVIERNVMFNALNGEGVKLGGPTTSTGTAGVTVRYNTIFNTAQSILIAGASSTNTIYRNILDQVGANYSGVRGYQLSGLGNVAAENLVYRAKAVLQNDSGYVGVQDGGGNVFPVDPMYDYVGPTGFVPQNPPAWEFGRYAPEPASP